MKLTLLLFVVALIPPPLLRWLVRWRFKTIQQLSPISLARALKDEPVLVLDVRTLDEFGSGHLASAIHVTNGVCAQQMIGEFLTRNPDGRVVAYCTVGFRSAQFVEEMVSAGCAHVENLEGGIWAWMASGQPIVTAAQS